MKRVEFSKRIILFMFRMVKWIEDKKLDYDVIIDYVKRGKETQKALFDKGFSKCDGVKKLSGHQSAKCTDLYFVDKMTGKMIFGKRGKEIYKYWHWRWERMGGSKVISWKTKDGSTLYDWPHFR